MKCAFVLGLLLSSGCLCCTPPDTGDVEGQLTDATVIVDTGHQEPTTTSKDRVCEEVVRMCDAKTSPAERAFCKSSLGC